MKTYLSKIKGSILLDYTVGKNELILPEIGTESTIIGKNIRIQRKFAIIGRKLPKKGSKSFRIVRNNAILGRYWPMLLLY